MLFHKTVNKMAKNAQSAVLFQLLLFICLAYFRKKKFDLNCIITVVHILSVTSSPKMYYSK